MLLNVEHLYKYFNGQALLKDINFTVEDREAVGLIGINGCGKSTLLNIITGSEGYDKTPEGETLKISFCSAFRILAQLSLEFSLL